MVGDTRRQTLVNRGIGGGPASDALLTSLRALYAFGDLPHIRLTPPPGTVPFRSWRSCTWLTLFIWRLASARSGPLPLRFALRNGC